MTGKNGTSEKIGKITKMKYLLVAGFGQVMLVQARIGKNKIDFYFPQEYLCFFNRAIF